MSERAVGPSSLRCLYSPRSWLLLVAGPLLVLVVVLRAVVFFPPRAGPDRIAMAWEVHGRPYLSREDPTHAQPGPQRLNIGMKAHPAPRHQTKQTRTKQALTR